VRWFILATPSDVGRFIVEGRSTCVQQKASVTSRLSAALRVAMTIDLQDAAEASWDGRSAISRRRLTTKSYLTIALPMRLGIKHASALEEEFKQISERSGPRSVPPKKTEAFYPTHFFTPRKISLFEPVRDEQWGYDLESSAGARNVANGAVD
jgi:hypothetical protein